MFEAVKKVVLAYSGGVDTSVILRWLQEASRCEVVTFPADLGQGEEFEPAPKGRAARRPRDLCRQFARGVRARFRLPDVSRQSTL
jgi:argininosuccinate synthase